MVYVKRKTKMELSCILFTIDKKLVADYGL